MSRDIPVASAGGLDPRAPRPDPRFNIYGALAAAAVAALAYVAALSADVLPSQGFSVVLFTAAPVLAGFALAVIWSRAKQEGDEPLAWAAVGLAVAVVAMLLQMISFPSVSSAGGIFGTSQSSNTALYLLFHLAVALGALLGALEARRSWRPVFVVVSVTLAAAFALDLIPVPELLLDGGAYSSLLVSMEFILAAVIAACTVGWVLRAGRVARQLNVWVGIGLSLSIYDVVLNAVAAQRFDAVWWSSLSMRVATYGVIAVGATATVLRQLRQAERYSEHELARREEQLRESLAKTQSLLARVTMTAQTLQDALLPHAIVAPAGVAVAARYRSASEHEDVGGGWYDTIQLPGGGLALVVGDVEGHDMRAAAVMGLVRGAVRSYALERHPPSIVLERVNAFLLSANIERQVCVSYVELYPHDRVVTAALAGAPAPMLVPHDGSRPTLLSTPPGGCLGADEQARWNEQTLLLPPNTSVVLYTNGILRKGDAADPTDQLLDAAAGAAALPSDDLADVLVEHPRGDDDVAVLVVCPPSTHAPSIQRTFPVDRISAAIARTWIVDLFALWQESGVLDAGPAAEDCGEVAQLLLTELISNAVRHSEQPISVTVGIADTRLRVEVHDSSHRMPVMRHQDGDETSGRGLLLVESLSKDWGVDVADDGKTVWFEISTEAPDADITELDEEALLAAFADAD